MIDDDYAYPMNQAPACPTPAQPSPQPSIPLSELLTLLYESTEQTLAPNLIALIESHHPETRTQTVGRKK
jgi:hypothetical protein